MSKSERYGAKQEVDELEVLSEKLAVDLRKNIRQLESFPILSDPWLEMAETFGRVAAIADMESKLSATKDDSTLWETEEQALRFMLEDGKLNLCLRSLVDFKKTQATARLTNEGVMLKFPQECDKFEKGIGSIMRNAWQHVEVLQTTDLHLLVNHMADVLEAAEKTPELVEGFLRAGDLHQRQEALVFYYLHGMLGHLDDIKEHRVMPQIRERKIFILGVKALCHYCRVSRSAGAQAFLTAHRLKACQALALLAETEDFCTYKEQYYNNSEVDAMLELRDGCLAELSKDFEARKTLRPLMDCIDKAKRVRSAARGK